MGTSGWPPVSDNLATIAEVVEALLTGMDKVKEIMDQYTCEERILNTQRVDAAASRCHSTQGRGCKVAYCSSQTCFPIQKLYL